MFKYTRAAIDIIIDDVKKYCNIFKYGSILFAIAYFTYAIYSKTGNFIINIVLLSLLVFYTLINAFTGKKEMKKLKRVLKRSYKGIKLATKTFSLAVMIYSIYTSTTNVSGILIILTTLMTILWILQMLFELIIKIFEDKKDLIVAGWSKDIDNLKKPVTTVNNFIKRIKGEDLVIELEEPSREIKMLEKKINSSKDKK